MGIEILKKRDAKKAAMKGVRFKTVTLYKTIKFEPWEL